MTDFVCPYCRSPAEITDHFFLGEGESTYVIVCTSNSCAVSRPMRISLSGNHSAARAATLAEIFLHLKEGVMI